MTTKATDKKEVEDKSQANQTQEDGQSGALGSQDASQVAEGQRGAGSDQPVLTRTEEEFREAQSVSDSRANEAQQELARFRMTTEIENARREETQAAEKDRLAVDAGDMSEAEANRNAQQRISTLGEQTRNRNLRQINDQLEQELAPRGRIAKAYLLADEFGVDAKTLIDDAKLTTPEEMSKAAYKLSNEAILTENKKLKNPEGEKFATGLGGGTGTSEVESLKGRYPTMYAK